MRSVRTGALIGVGLAGVFTAFNAVNCASATTITLEVRGDNDICDQINETGIVVTSAKNVDNTSDFPLQQFQKGCANGKVGTLVITPHSSDSADRNAHIGIRVVAGLQDKNASACDTDDGSVATNCIIAKRTVTFVEGSNVPLTVTLNGRCVHFSCEKGYTCNPDEPDPEKRCVPPGTLDPGSSSSGGPMEDVSRPPVDTGPDPEKDGGADSGPATPKQLCETKQSHVWDGTKCVITCGPAGDDCKKPDTCPQGIDCQFQCVGPKGCENVSCLGNHKCEFVCATKDSDLCHNIACDAGSCNVKCRVGENACNGVILTGKTNVVVCQKGGDGQDKVSCDDVHCIPGPNNGTCERSCDGPPPNACGPKAECDAGDCTKFEAGAN